MADPEVPVATEKPVKVYKGDGASLNNLFFTANYIFSGSQEDGKLRVLHKTKDDEARQYDVALKGLYHFNNVLVVVRSDHQMALWSISEKRERARLEGHEKWITSVVFLENGHMLSASADNTLRLWDISSVTQSGQGPNPGLQSKKLASTAVFKGHKDTVTALVLCAGDIFSGSADNTVRRWNTAGRLVETMEGTTGHTNWVLAMATDSKKHVVSTSRDQTMKIWAIKKKRMGGRKPSKCLATVELDGAPHLMRMNERNEIFVATSSNIITSYSLAGKKLHTFEGHTGKIRSMIFKEAALYTASSDRTLRKWSARTGRVFATYQGHEKGVNSAQIEGGSLYSVSDDGDVCQWSLRDVEDKLAWYSSDSNKTDKDNLSEMEWYSQKGKQNKKNQQLASRDAASALAWYC
mmetsp:Transcript_12179/g.30849  ORF Transcript_12179/g.30849 Transcript_12179/m.30849 type:complete len:408 (-) Transcript_12179:117-1340(-)|eukprot:CAMPEP_0177658518 /NCGR_PEP_ID=MMETSP0447-20121125/16855_1 /TAXON_ID=0 /ORGANISM="Stygamoeba regulata, Strain BSH-02190019" /LENGTH=407 /DNA_ID=CAMNT_0019163133 /DNA_START=167 /DNA_END=1390 /DNA_ORIENTATION=-